MFVQLSKALIDRKFIFGIQNIYVKFVYQGHRVKVKVKVTRARIGICQRNSVYRFAEYLQKI